MKKITLLVLLSLSALSLQAQNKYTATTSQQTYSNLESPTSISGGMVWDFDDFPEVTIPFTFKMAGQTVNRFLFDDDNFAFITPNGDYEDGVGVFYFSPSMAYIQDRTYSTGTSTSPISYKTEGVLGNRILKIELKNVGLENAVDLGFAEDHFYMNIQIWLYETDNSIEIRYGDHNVSFNEMEDSEDFAFFTAIEEVTGEETFNVYVLHGQNTNATYSEFNEQNTPTTLFSNAFPTNGTVYRLGPNQIAGIVDFSASSVKLYPNPASSVLNIQSENLEASEYAIYNVVGKMVAQNTIADSNNIQVNVSNLEKGLYFVKINNKYLKFVKE